MAFTKELDFEHALVKLLVEKHGWDNKTANWGKEVLNNPTEQDLIDNWAEILFRNNKQRDRLNDVKLTDSEMAQILEQIAAAHSPMKINEFINGSQITIKRDNPEDTEHYGKEISLEIFNRMHIKAGETIYQIAEQPVFKTNKGFNDRRGDLLLLINGMPLYHIELKRSGVSIIEACNQIKKYAKEGAYTGIYSLIQIFVAMTPEKALYFANPGSPDNFNESFYFKWADFDNNPIENWQDFSKQFLSIPTAHQIIGFYTIAEKDKNGDGVLKVMRSYQYYAANKIIDKVAKTDWTLPHGAGGYVWHTTGSGKTMTSFKSAQLIAENKYADKVIFLMDRIELTTQSFEEYKSFLRGDQEIQNTYSTDDLISKLRSDDYSNSLIVTSIQKMSNIKTDVERNIDADIEKINRKRLVFIIDEAHRSTSGDMLATIKENFPGAIFFGFTGTPRFDENRKGLAKTEEIFGDELHRYTISDGIRDHNVLGFDTKKVLVYKDMTLKKLVAENKSLVASEEEVMSDEAKMKVYKKYMDMQMADKIGKDSKTIEKGIEGYLPKGQYKTKEYEEGVVENILENWNVQSEYGMFHAMFATSSISEAISYYRIFKEKAPDFKVTALFDPNIDNSGDSALDKEDGLVEIHEDYFNRFMDGREMSHIEFKKDIANRLAHKRQYSHIKKEEQLDLLIVVDQMLTGYDSKWVNTLYLDKIIDNELLIQAFSRTNRIFNKQYKKCGTIKYYRKPHTMEKIIEKAVEVFSGNRPYGVFASKIGENIREMNDIYKDIKKIFEEEKIENFQTMPKEDTNRKKFVSLFNKLANAANIARIQGFDMNDMTKEYVLEDKVEGEEGYDEAETITADFDKHIYDALRMRYKDIATDIDPEGTGKGEPEEPLSYDLETYLVEIDSETIDYEYMNSRFKKYLALLELSDAEKKERDQALSDLHSSFATLSKERQKIANIFLHDIESGKVHFDENKTFMDYIIEREEAKQQTSVKEIAEAFGLDATELQELIDLHLDDTTINQVNRMKNIKEALINNKDRARAFMEKFEGQIIKPRNVISKSEMFIKTFIITGGKNYEEKKEEDDKIKA